jgi:DNA (cytosine-5)-methyltransferase 1
MEGYGMTFLDLFAGVGGFRRGMELAGHKCIGFCEWDKYARASYISMHCVTEEQRQYLATLDLRKRQKEILKDEYLNGEWCSTDIRNVDAGNIPKADCWCFGAPCQDFSVAGKRAGLDGDRSSLIREVFRIIREEREQDRPEWLIYENVKGMLSSNRGGDFLSILMEMDELGYDTEWQIFNSKNWGVPQNRERVYTVGHFRAKGKRQIFPIGTADGKDSIQVRQIGQIEANRDNPQRYRVYSGGGGKSDT